MTILNAWTSANAGALGTNWTNRLDPLEAGAIVVGALVILGAIPATSKFALWAALGIFFFLIVTGTIKGSATHA